MGVKLSLELDLSLDLDLSLVLDLSLDLNVNLDRKQRTVNCRLPMLVYPFLQKRVQKTRVQNFEHVKVEHFF